MKDKNYYTKLNVAVDLISEINKYSVWHTIPDWDNKRAKILKPELMSDRSFWELIAGLTRILYDFRDTYELWNSDVIGGRDD